MTVYLKKSYVLSYLVGCSILILFCLSSTACGQELPQSIDTISIRKELPMNPFNDEALVFDNMFSQPNGDIGGTFFSEDKKTLTLTRDNGTTGTIWSKKQVDLTKNFSVDSYMFFGNKSPNFNTVADGVVFALQAKSQTWIGEPGGGLGMYKTGILGSGSLQQYGLGIEFDTYDNADDYDRDHNNDIGSTRNHVALMKYMWSTSPKYAYHSNLLYLDYGTLANGYWKKFDFNWIVSDGQVKLKWRLGQVNTDKSIIPLLENEVSLGELNSVLTKHFAGSKTAWWGYTSSIGVVANDSYNAVAFSGIPEPRLVLQNKIIKKIGERWNPMEAYIEGYDQSGQKIDPSLIKEDVSGVDLTKKGIYTVKYVYNDIEAATQVYVKGEPEINLKQNIANYYIGREFDYKKYIDSVIDIYGRAVDFSEVTFEGTDWSVVNTPDKSYYFIYKYKDSEEPSSFVMKDFIVIAKKDRMSLKTQNSLIQKGGEWDPKENFISATDKDGNLIQFSSIDMSKANIDTSKVGQQTASFEYDDGERKITSSFTVTVLGSLELTSVPEVLKWTNLTASQSKGLLERDKDNPINITISDTREFKNEWSLFAVAAKKVPSLETDLVWKEKISSTPVSLSQGIFIGNKATAQAEGDLYRFQWNSDTGVLLSSNNYLSVGEYGEGLNVMWVLYDTPVFKEEIK